MSGVYQPRVVSTDDAAPSVRGNIDDIYRILNETKALLDKHTKALSALSIPVTSGDKLAVTWPHVPYASAEGVLSDTAMHWMSGCLGVNETSPTGARIVISESTSTMSGLHVQFGSAVPAVSSLNGVTISSGYYGSVGTGQSVGLTLQNNFGMGGTGVGYISLSVPEAPSFNASRMTIYADSDIYISPDGDTRINSKLDARENVVVNELGADWDVRIEGDTDQNLLFTDASTDRVGVGTNVPGAKFHVESGTQDACRLGASDSNTGLTSGHAPRLLIQNTNNTTNNTEDITFADSVEINSQIVNVNQSHTTHASALSFQTRPASGSITEALRLSSAQYAGIGTSDPQAKLHVYATSSVTCTTVEVARFDSESTGDALAGFGGHIRLGSEYNTGSSYPVGEMGRISWTPSSSTGTFMTLGLARGPGSATMDTIIQLYNYTTSTSGYILLNRRISIVGLPTSSAGLSAGDVWNDSGTLKIV